MRRTSRPVLSPSRRHRRYPLSAARKLSIARLSGTAATVPVFVEVLRAAFERGFFEIEDAVVVAVKGDWLAMRLEIA